MPLPSKPGAEKEKFPKDIKKKQKREIKGKNQVYRVNSNLHVYTSTGDCALFKMFVTRSHARHSLVFNQKIYKRQRFAENEGRDVS